MVVGLGNPGPEYQATRHNIGFRVVDAVAASRGVGWRRFGWLRPVAWVAADAPVILVKPRTSMNRSGVPVGALCARHRIAPGRCIAVYDDADLELGRIRVRKSGGSGGHNGVRSLTGALGTEAYPRVRLGVKGRRREGCDLAHYLLSSFDESEGAPVAGMIADAAEAVRTILERDVESAMNEFNSKDRSALAGDG
jgi:PTH1 family peptidyl-tRNA hydrolase